jgi:hypothetical protein
MYMKKLFRNWLRNLFRIAFLFLLFFLSDVRAFAEQTDEIQTCKAGNGQTWYFSIGQEVFKINLPIRSEFLPIIQDVDHAHALVVPDSKVPVGCKDNPQQLNYFNATDWLRLKSDKDLSNMPKGLFVFAMGRNWNKVQNQNFTSADINTLRLRYHFCTGEFFVKTWDDGTVYCTNSEVGLKSLTTPFGTVWQFIISPKAYLTPLKQQLTMTKSYDVQTNYLLSPDLSLSYAWIPPKQEIPINPNYVINVDKMVQKAVHELLVKNYPWPNISNNR